MSGLARYCGLDKRGIATTGVLPPATDLSRWVRSRFQAGWRRLSVTRDGGVEVGAICPHPDSGRRTWWAER